MWEEAYRDRLLIRPRTQHSTCSECIRHRVILKKISGEHRQVQMKHYKRHLARQYADRLSYWRLRAQSRLVLHSQLQLVDDVIDVCMMLDSVDHQKFPLPKSEIMYAKSFSKFIRPTLQLTACICHGHSFHCFVSEPYVSHNSSWTTDLVCSCLHELGKTIDLRRVRLSLHGDNCSRELKNQTILRCLALFTSQHRLKSAQLCTLQSGHSHEDLDQCFSQMASHLATEKELHSPDEYVASLTRWASAPGFRPGEGIKRVIKVDQCRSWILLPS